MTAGFSKWASALFAKVWGETKALFKALDNPAIPIYIYPHVALIGDEQLVKPGFTTEFFLYKQNQFALASERY